jgi:hypothetical protein
VELKCCLQSETFNVKGGSSYKHEMLLHLRVYPERELHKKLKSIANPNIE